MIIKNTIETKIFFSRVLELAATTVPKKDRAPGENGHIIHYSKNCKFVHILHRSWNNNTDPKLNDYIRHYSTGPMRKHYRKTILSKLYRKFVVGLISLRRQLANAGMLYRKQPNKPWRSNLNTLVSFCKKQYTVFNNETTKKGLDL